jgi:hypothetical protein
MTHQGYPLSVKRNDLRKKRLLVLMMASTLQKPLVQKPTDQSTNGGASDGRAHNFERKEKE